MGLICDVIRGTDARFMASAACLRIQFSLPALGAAPELGSFFLTAESDFEGGGGGIINPGCSDLGCEMWIMEERLFVFGGSFL